MLWEHSSAGRALALQARGHRFEPCCSHHIWPGSSVGLERQPVTLEVVGSSPIRVAIFADVAHLVERHLAKVEVAGSSPVIRSKNIESGFRFILRLTWLRPGTAHAVRPKPLVCSADIPLMKGLHPLQKSKNGTIAKW